jgi:hypothetical protein
LAPCTHTSVVFFTSAVAYAAKAAPENRNTLSTNE